MTLIVHVVCSWLEAEQFYYSSSHKNR